MQILTVDVGTGTQDVLLFDSEREIENCFKLVMPSPTAVVANRVRAVTAAGRPLVLTGVTMGGGPCHWATMDHLRAGHRVYATAEAAQTFDDDLEGIAAMGIQVVSPDEAEGLARAGGERIVLRDFWLDPLLETFAHFGVDVRLDGLAVAVFDHGAAPPGYSDRAFRFDYLRERLGRGAVLASFGFPRDKVPPSMTRLRAVADSAPTDLPLLVMDTAPAAVLGALDDGVVRAQESAILVNVGNFHCLAFHLVEGEVAGLFEHHTGELTADRLVRYVEDLRSGGITNETVFADKGHGALVLNPCAPGTEFVAVTGPRRALLVGSGMQLHQAVPHGDMMLAGNVGLLRAYAARDESVAAAVESRLGAPHPASQGVPA